MRAPGRTFATSSAQQTTARQTEAAPLVTDGVPCRLTLPIAGSDCGRLRTYAASRKKHSHEYGAAHRTALAPSGVPATKADQPSFLVAQVHRRLGGEIPLPHFEVSSFLAAAIGLLGFVSLCLLVFGRLGIGSIVAFLVAGLLVGTIRDLPDESILALREFAELGVILLLFLIGLEIKPSQLSSLGRDAISFGLPQIAVSAGAISVYAWLFLARRRARSRLCLVLDDCRRPDPTGS
jgi:sodium/hydrogen exchanger family protein